MHYLTPTRGELPTRGGALSPPQGGLISPHGRHYNECMSGTTISSRGRSTGLACALALASLPSILPAAGPVSVSIPRRQLAEQGRVIAIDASFSGNSGNGSGFQAGGGVTSAALFGGGRHLAYFRGKIAYAEFEKMVTASDSYAHLRHQFELLPWLLTDLFTQVQQDRFQRLSSRRLFGGGPAFRILDREGSSIYAGTGIMHEREVYRDAAGSMPEPDEDTFRSTSYVILDFGIGGNAGISFAGYLQPRIDRAADTRILGEAALSVGLGRLFSMSISLAVRHDNEPPDGVKPTDLAVRNSLTVSL